MAENVTAAPWELPFPSATGKVSLGATDFKELAERIAKLMGEKWATIKAYAGPGTLKTGELALQGKSGETFTLPAAGTANQLIGIANTTSSGNCKVTTSGGATIYGDFVINQATITLVGYQHVTLQSDGTNWLIVAGEPKREQVYSTKSYTQAEWAAGIVFSTARPVQVIPGASVAVVSIGGASINLTLPAFEVPAGQSVIATTSGSVTVAMLLR